MDTTKKTHHQYMILGSGPAGLQTGYFLQKKKLDYIMLEKGDNVSQSFRKFPRHRTLISINKPNNDISNPDTQLRFDWNSLLNDEGHLFSNYTEEFYPNADILVEYLEDFQKKFKLNIKYNTSVETINKNKDGIFEVKTSTGETYTSNVLISAMGFGKHYMPKSITGLEHCDHYATFNPDDQKYKKKTVVIMGKGNSAFETAREIMKYADFTYLVSPNKIKFASETHYVGSVRTVNDYAYEVYQLKSRVVTIDGNPVEITRKENGRLNMVITSKLERYDLECDYVINATGFQMNSDFYDESIKPDMRCCGKLPLADTTFQSTNVKDLYYSGTIMHACDYKKGTSGFIHGFRHNIEFMANWLSKKYNEGQLPYENIEYCPKKLAKRFLKSGGESSTIFLQVGTLCDAALINKEKKTIKYYPGLRTDFCTTNQLEKEEGEVLIIFYLNYGIFYTRGVEGCRPVDEIHGYSSSYLHPYFFYYIQDKGESKFIGHYEMIEDIENNFNGEKFHNTLNRLMPVSFDKMFDKSTLKVEKETSYAIPDSIPKNNYFMIQKLCGNINKNFPDLNLYFSFFKFIPFTHVKDHIMYTNNPFPKGSSMEVKDADGKTWSLRITDLCQDAGTLLLEFVPSCTSISMGYVYYYLSWCLNDKKIKVKTTYHNDLSDNMKASIEKSLLNIEKVLE